jgi:peptidoglycan/xylan/chitin deacetylase (PgdA/CDA1 family)
MFPASQQSGYLFSSRFICLVAALLAAQFFLAVLPAQATAVPGGLALVNNVPNPAGIRFFNETGHNVSGPFLQNYYVTGGLPVNGLPLTEEFKDIDGLTVQIFERAVFELHQPPQTSSEAQPKAYVEHKLLGSLITAGRKFERVANGTNSKASRYFPETGHTLSHGFLQYWTSNGGLAAFGYPLSEEFSEKNPSDGKNYTVQYFERSRFEYHPEHAGTPYEVQLGLLGRQYTQVVAYDPALFAPVKSLLLGSQQVVAVPSLMYHHIRDLTSFQDAIFNNYSVTPGAFIEQLDWLKANGYHTVTVAQIVDYLKYGVPLPPKPVNLRFDDGWQNQLFAAREMKKRGMTATFYIISQALNYPYMTPAQVRQLDADGFEIASHSRSHPFLTRYSLDFAWDQISGSKADLERLLNHPVRGFAYPYGDRNPAIDGLVQKAGYDFGAGIEGSVFWRANRLFNAPTISVSNVLTLSTFISRVKTGI